MSTLSKISSDCLDHLIGYLADNDLISLLSSGDRVLRQKIVFSASRVSLRFGPNEKFPFSVLQWPRLLSFSIKACEYHYVRFLEDERAALSAPKAQQSRITSLQLHFRNASSLFTRPGSMSLQERFPSLTDLDLCCYGTMTLFNSFSTFPETLRSLKLRAHSSAYATCQPSYHLYLSSLSKLPRSLTTLEIRWNPITEPGETDSSDDHLKDLLPPHLTALSLSTLNELTIISHLPSSLEKLNLEFVRTSRVKVPVSSLPRTLTSLDLNAPLKYDSPLPPNLAHFEVPRDSYQMLLALGNGDPSWSTILPLPPSLEVSPPDFLSLPDDLFRNFKRFGRLGIAKQEHLDEICGGKVAEGFPRELTVFFPGLNFMNPLPSGIKSFGVCNYMRGEDLKLLPSRLEAFDIQFWHEINDASLPLPWTLEQVALLPKTLRTLNLPFHVVDRGEKLAPIRNLFLERFELRRVPPQELHNAKRWLPLCLPFYLKFFELHTRTEDRDADVKVSPDCLRACELGKVIPHLQSLTMSVPFSNDLPMGRLFESIPQNIGALFLHTFSNVFEFGAFVSLPKSIESLGLSLRDDVSDVSGKYMNSMHFEGIPEKLGHLHLVLPKEHRVDGKMTAYLPRTLCSIYLYAPRNDIGELQTASQAFLTNNMRILMNKADE